MRPGRHTPACNTPRRRSGSFSKPCTGGEGAVETCGHRRREVCGGHVAPVTASSECFCLFYLLRSICLRPRRLSSSPAQSANRGGQTVQGRLAPVFSGCVKSFSIVLVFWAPVRFFGCNYVAPWSRENGTVCIAPASPYPSRPVGVRAGNRVTLPPPFHAQNREAGRKTRSTQSQT